MACKLSIYFSSIESLSYAYVFNCEVVKAAKNGTLIVDQATPFLTLNPDFHPVLLGLGLNHPINTTLTVHPKLI